jgi:hypothetical protein
MMSTLNRGGIMSKAKDALSNGNVKTVFQFGAIIFAAGILWAKVSGLETQLGDLKNTVDVLVHHLLGTP